MEAYDQWKSFGLHLRELISSSKVFADSCRDFVGPDQRRHKTFNTEALARLQNALEPFRDPFDHIPLGNDEPEEVDSSGQQNQ